MGQQWHFIRLRGYDYATTGAYFVTICLNWRIPKKMQPRSAIGQPRWVAPTGTQMEFGFPTFGLVENGVMVLNDSGKMIQQIWYGMPKYYSGIELGEQHRRGNPTWLPLSFHKKLWQRNYYERIIRDDAEKQSNFMGQKTFK